MNSRKCFSAFLYLVLMLCFQLKVFATSYVGALNLCRHDTFFNKTLSLASLADTNSLRHAVIDFIAKADSGRVNDVINYYDPGFLSVRVVGAGQFIKMDYNQMVSFWKMITGRQTAANASNRKTISSTSTVIHYMEIIGDTGYVFMTRVKDFGSGPEPVFYNLIWLNKNNKWFLLREIVHQRTAPNFH